MRTLMVTSVPLPGNYDGSTMLPIQVLRGLRRAGRDVQVAYLRARPPWGEIERGEFEGAPYWTVPMRYWVGGLEQIHTEFPFDVVHAEHYGGATRAFFACRKHQWPMVYSIHSLLGDEVERDRLGRGLSFRVNRALERRACAFAAGVVVLGEGVKRVVVDEKGVPADRVSVIYPGMDLTPYRNPGPPSDIPGITDEHKVVMYIGNIVHPNQGVPKLIEALPQVFANVPEARCVLVGGPIEAWATYRAQLGPYGDRLLVLAGKTPDDIVGLTQRANVLVHSRLECRENYSVQTKMAVYLAARRPIVATDFGDYRTILGATSAGLLTPIDPTSLANAIGRVLTEPELAYALQAQTWAAAEQFFCMDRNIQRYIEAHERARAMGPQRQSRAQLGFKAKANAKSQSQNPVPARV